MKTGKIKLSRSLKLHAFMFLCIGGLLIHSFSLDIGVNFKLSYLVVVLFFVSVFLKKKQYFNLQPNNISIFVFLFFIAVLSLFSSVDGVFGYSSLKYYMYLILTLLFSLVFVFSFNTFIRYFNIYLKLYISIMVVSIFIYFYIVFFVDLDLYIKNIKSLDNPKEKINTIYSFVFPEYGGMFLRFNGYNLDPNFWGSYALLSFWMLILFKTFTNHTFSKQLYKVALLLSIVSIIITFSRSTLLTFILSLGIFSILSMNKNYIYLLLFGTSCVLVSFAALYINVPVFNELINLKSGDLGVENPRFEKWQFYLNIILNDGLFRFFFGYGLTDLFTWHYGTTMHNTYLQAFVSIGFLAMLLIFFWVLFSVIIILSNYSTRFSPVQLALLFSTLFSVFMIDMFYASVFWIGLILPLYTVFYNKEKGTIGYDNIRYL